MIRSFVFSHFFSKLMVEIKLSCFDFQFVTSIAWVILNSYFPIIGYFVLTDTTSIYYPDIECNEHRPSLVLPGSVNMHENRIMNGLME